MDCLSFTKLVKRTDYDFGGEVWGFVSRPLDWRWGPGGGFGCRICDLFVFNGVMKRAERCFCCEIWGFLYVCWSDEENRIGFWWLDLVVYLLFARVLKRIEWDFCFRLCGGRRSYCWLFFGALLHRRVEILTDSS